MKKKPISTPALDRAEAEARRFLARVADLRNALVEFNGPEWKHPLRPTDCPRENAAVKRASMDLSRALVAVRGRA